MKSTTKQPCSTTCFSKTVDLTDDNFVLENEEVYLNDLGCSEQDFPHLEHLFEFVISSDPCFRNPTAAQYFVQVVESLLVKDQTLLLGFIYSHKKVLKNLVANIDVCAYKGLLGKVLIFPKEDDRPNTSFKFLKYRFTLAKKLFEYVVSCEQGNQPEEDSAGTKEVGLKNAVSLLATIVKDSDKIVDSDYFIDRILLDKKNLKRLICKTKATLSVELLGLVGLLAEALFEKAEKKTNAKPVLPKEESKEALRNQQNEFVENVEIDLGDFSTKRMGENEQVFEKSKQCEQARDSLGEVVTFFGKGQSNSARSREGEGATREGPANPEGTPRLAVEAHEFDVEEEGTSKEWQSTAETSNGPVCNIELDLYDDGELRKGKAATRLCSLVDHLATHLLSDQHSPAPLNASTQSIENRPTGTRKVAIIKMLALLSRLNSANDLIGVLITSDKLDGLLSLFRQNPVNNILHCELSQLMSSLIDLLHHERTAKARNQLLEVVLGQLSTYVEAFTDKRSSSGMLFKSHLLQIVDTTLFVFHESTLETPPFDDHLRLLTEFSERENQIINNSVFKQRQRNSVFSIDLVFDIFQTENECSEANQSPHSKHLTNLEVESWDPNYSSNRPGVDSDALNDLIFKIKNGELLTDFDRDRESDSRENADHDLVPDHESAKVTVDLDDDFVISMDDEMTTQKVDSEKDQTE